MNGGTKDFEYTMEGLDQQFNRATWLSGKVPKISSIPRFRDDLTGKNLKRFMHEKIVMPEGEGSDRVVGVTSPQLVQYLRLQEEREREEKRKEKSATVSTGLQITSAVCIYSVRCCVNAARMVYLIPQWPVGLRD